MSDLVKKYTKEQKPNKESIFEFFNLNKKYNIAVIDGKYWKTDNEGYKKAVKEWD
jgi:hypothetical protein